MDKKLASWSDRFIGNTKHQILVATEVILSLDVAMESRAFSAVKINLRRVLKRKLLGLASLEWTIARHSSRVLWLKEGDACTPVLSHLCVWQETEEFYCTPKAR